MVADAQAAAQAAAADALIGQVIADRYRLVRKLGEGGMGEVYEAEHVHIEKRVALKLLRPEILSNQEAVQRFRQEARSASSIGHENIIQIDDFGNLPDGRVYLSMEFLAGAPLAELCRQQVLPLGSALDILIQTCRGLAAAHAKGIVHRDMKPENIFVTHGKDGREVPKILDFGIAKVSGADDHQNLTRTGTIFGTPFYMAPEQALGQKLDHRADIYAMGVILYEVFTGTVPFKAESFMGILTQHITTPPEPPSLRAAQTGRQVPPELEAIILRALAKNPAERFATMNELDAALTEVRRHLVGPGMTGSMAVAPRSPSQFVPVPGTSGAMASTPTPPPMLPGTMASQGVPIAGYTTGGDYAAPARGRGGLVLAFLGLFALGGGGAAAWYFLSGQKEAKGGQAPSASPVASTAVPVITPPPAREPVKPVEPAPAPAPATPRNVMVLIASVPDRAVIFKGTEMVGDTPYPLYIPEGETWKLTLKRKGYKDATVEVLGDPKKRKVSVDLEAERVVRPPGPRPPAQTPVKPKPGPGDDSDELE